MTLTSANDLLLLTIFDDATVYTAHVKPNTAFRYRLVRKRPRDRAGRMCQVPRRENGAIQR